MESADLGLLVSLDALLQEGSVTKAARRVGLSTPAMSHALARIRERLGDPILVRSGRGMLLTPRAEALKPRVHSVVAEARHTLEPDRPFVARELSRDGADRLPAHRSRADRDPARAHARTPPPRGAAPAATVRAQPGLASALRR